MKLYYLSIITLVCLHLVFLQANAELPIDSLNSAFFSKIRFEIRHVEDPIQQCAHYWEKIYSKLHSDEAEQIDNRSLLERLDIDLLVRVSKLLISRQNRFGPSSLSEYTDNCIDLLNKNPNRVENVNNNNDKNNLQTSTSQETSATQSDNNSVLLTRIEEDNRRLMKELASQVDNNKILEQRVKQMGEELELANKKNEKLSDGIDLKTNMEKVNIDLNKCYNDLKDSREAKDRVEQLKAKLDSSLDSCNKDMTGEKVAKDKLTNELNYSKTRIQSLENDLINLQHLFEDKEKNLTIKGEEIDNCRNNLTTSEQKLHEFESHKTDDERVAKELKQENNDLKNKYEELENKFNQIDQKNLEKLPELVKKSDKLDEEYRFLRRLYNNGYTQYCFIIRERLNGDEVFQG